LRAFAAAVKPFEGDETSAMGMGRHAEMINHGLAFGTKHGAHDSAALANVLPDRVNFLSFRADLSARNLLVAAAQQILRAIKTALRDDKLRW
jgi:hypothetical protein